MEKFKKGDRVTVVGHLIMFGLMMISLLIGFTGFTVGFMSEKKVIINQSLEFTEELPKINDNVYAICSGSIYQGKLQSINRNKKGFIYYEVYAYIMPYKICQSVHSSYEEAVYYFNK